MSAVFAILRRQVLLTAKRAVLLAACAATVAPMIWLISASFSRTATLFAAPFAPKDLTLANYTSLFHSTDFGIWVKNSAIVCGAGALLSLALTTSMGYAFSRLRFRGRDAGLLTLLLIQMVPSSITVVAIYYLLTKVQLINTYPGLVLVYGGTNIPFSAWLLKGYFDSLPRELEEAAFVDGASRRAAMLRVILPLALPMLAVVFLFNVIAFYNDYVLVSIVFTGSEHYTVGLGLRFFQAETGANWALYSAGALAGAVPLAALFYALQRFIVGGLAAGAVKG